MRINFSIEVSTDELKELLKPNSVKESLKEKEFNFTDEIKEGDTCMIINLDDLDNFKCKPFLNKIGEIKSIIKDNDLSYGIYINNSMLYVRDKNIIKVKK